MLRARRLGYMAVLRWKNVKGKPAPMPGGAVRRTKLLCIVGPFWPFTCCVTFPLIFLISGAIGIAVCRYRASSDQNSLGFISVVSGHGVVVCGLPRSRDSEAPSGKTGSQLALERPSWDVSTARRVL